MKTYSVRLKDGSCKTVEADFIGMRDGKELFLRKRKGFWRFLPAVVVLSIPSAQIEGISF